MNNITTKKKVATVIFLLVLPWFNSDLEFIGSADIVRQEDVTFYEINPCKVSLIDFILSNPKSIYQDHYNFKFDNNSSLICYGRVTGMTVIDSNFFVSVGTNTLISFILQSLIWILVMSFIKKDENLDKLFNSTKLYNTSIILTSLVFTFALFSENRYYSNNIYGFSRDERILKYLVFTIFLFVLKNLLDIFCLRSKKIINYLPIIFLFQGIATGANISIFIGIFIFIAIYFKLENPHMNLIEKFYFVVTFFWVMNSTKNYYFEPGKLRGFTNSFYDVKTTFIWSLIFYLVIFGLFKFCKNIFESFSFDLFLSVFTKTSIFIFFLGIIGANFPIANFMNFYFFGSQKAGITRNSLFTFDEWGEIDSWRGFYTSAETVGEFYGLVLILLIFKFTRTRNKEKILILGFITSLFGLLSSDNRTALVLVIFFCIYFFAKFKKYKKIGYFLIIFFSLFLVIYFFGVQNFSYELDFIKSKLFSRSFSFSYGLEQSSFLKYINNSESTSLGLKLFLQFVSILAYFLNRTEMWGLFFARYNPTYIELLFGTGPLNFGQLYGEVYINEPESFLLPHSSLLSFLVFFGVIGVILLFSFYIYFLFKNKYKVNFLGFYISIFILINILKNDSLNYFPNFLLYSFLFLAILNFDNKSLFSSIKTDVESNKNNTNKIK